MGIVKFLLGDCLEWMDKIFEKSGQCIDVVLTSPPYNTSRPSTERSMKNYEGRYGVYEDLKTNAEYCDWCINIFNYINKILKPNGVVLWNVSYGTDATVNTEGIGLMWNSISDIIRYTDFTFDNPLFDNAIIGVDSEGKLVYSFDKMVIEFAEENNLGYIEALEFVEYNTMRALPYFGDYAPIVIYDNIEV